MNLGQVKRIIAAQVGYSDYSDIDTLLEDSLDLAQRELEEDPTLYPWFLVEHNATLVTSAGVAYVALPNDFLRWVEDTTVLKLSDSTYSGFELDDYNALRLAYAVDEDAMPQGASLVGTRVYFVPTPDAAYTYYYSYYKKAAEPSGLLDSATNEWLTQQPQLLIAKAGVELAQALEHAGGIQYFSAKLQMTYDRFQRRGEEWRLGGVDSLSMGDD
jgi:hypothetical protein